DVLWAPDGKSVVVYGKIPDIYWVDLATRTSKELRGHTDSIYMAQFTSDGRGLLTAGDDQTARLWNLADGSSTALLGHEDDVYRARFSPSEELAATSSLDGSIRIWPVPRKQPGVLMEGQPIQEMSFTGDTALVRTEVAVARWQLDRGTRDQLFATGPHDGFGIGQPSPDGTRLVVHKPGWVLELRSKDHPPIELRGHKALISHVEWSRDGRYVYSASFDGTLRRWDAETGAPTILVQSEAPVRGFAVAADGRVAVQVGSDALMLHPDGTQETLGTGAAWCGTKAEFERVRDRLLIHRCDNGLVLVDGKRVVELPTEGYAVSRIAVSPDGHLFAGATADRTVRVWDDTGRQLSKLWGHKDLVMDVAFSPDGKEVASASYDRTIRIWQLGTQRHRVLRGHAGAVSHVAWRSQNELVSGSQDGTLRLWQVPSLDLPTEIQVTARLKAATTAMIDVDKPTTL
ncbi:MAG: hypothetical protein JO257_03500, partial [Deltaproteobacteria bacterium]|nr:hypothetical protein [Deltaproteobacteria bacterium]